MACCKLWTCLVCRFFFCYSSSCLINVSLLLCSKVSPSYLFVVCVRSCSLCTKISTHLWKLCLFSLSFPLLPTWWINLCNKLFNPLVPNLKHLCIGVWKWVSLIGLQNICKSSMFSSSSIVCVGLPCWWLQILHNYILFLKYNIKPYIWLYIL